jgi:glycosyltransferase involved in cell wall biosynthesis
MTKSDKPTFSILIGLVSTEDGDRVLEAIDALGSQEGNHSYEIIIADRMHTTVSDTIREKYPQITLLPCPPTMSLPMLRTLALDKAKGEFVAVIEDHNVPSTNWLVSVYDAFQKASPDTVAVGGCVENGVTGTPLDWATFLCEYSFFLTPVQEGELEVIPGMNVCYRHNVLKDVDRNLLTSGFWETTVHPVLLQNKQKLYSTNDIKLFHSKEFSFGLFAKQRLIYSRYYAGLRFKKSDYLHRMGACAATIALPPLLLFRMYKQMRSKGRFFKEFKSALPILFVFTIIWALGEMQGYILGPGDALAKIE